MQHSGGCSNGATPPRVIMKSYKHQTVRVSAMQSAHFSLIFYRGNKSHLARCLRENINNIYHPVCVGPPESSQEGYVHLPRKPPVVTLRVSKLSHSLK